MPIPNKFFGGVISQAHTALNLRMEKQGLIQSNIANIETPGYKVQDFSFETVMGKAIQNKGELARTNPKHLQLDPLDVSASTQFTSEDRPVDLDEEMLKLSENQLMYQIAAKIMAKKLEGLKAAIDEGGK